MPWRRQFPAPLPLKKARQIATIRNAVELFMSLPPEIRDAACRWRLPCPPAGKQSSRRAPMFNIGSHPSQTGASSRRILQNWPLMILFAGLGLNLAWVLGLSWLAIKLAVRLLVG
jgi:hypothetical protein